jgi:hypothetical protein
MGMAMFRAILYLWMGSRCSGELVPFGFGSVWSAWLVGVLGNQSREEEIKKSNVIERLNQLVRRRVSS